MKVPDTEGFLDKVLLHNKNADERLFDLILRSLTFIVLLLIVLIYSSVVHADEEYNVIWNDIDYAAPTQITYGSYDSFSQGVICSEDSIVSSFSDYYGSSVYVPINTTNTIFYNWRNFNNRPDWFTDEYIHNMPIVTSYTWNGIVYNLDNSYLMITVDVMNSASNKIGCTFFPKSDWYISNQYIYRFDGNVTRWELPYIQISYSNGQYYANKNQHAAGNWNGGTKAVNHILCSNMPLYYQNGVSITSNEMQLNPLDSWTSGYIVDVNIPLVSGSLEPVIPEPQESNENNMYFDNVQIGLSYVGNRWGVASANVIVGVEVNDYILNHLPEYYVYFNVHSHAKDNNIFLQDPNSGFSTIVPLSAFLDTPYIIGLNEIWTNSPVSVGNYTNFLQYIKDLETNHSITVKGTKYDNGLFPSLKGVTEGFKISNYSVNKSDGNNNFHLTDLDIEVSVVLTDDPNALNTNSGPYTKKFDFIYGTESVINATGLVNQNPWTGEQEPEANPLVPSGGGSVSNGGGYGSVNQSVNINFGNGYKDTELHQLTEQDIQTNHQNIIRTFESIKEAFQYLYDETKDGGFIPFVNDTIGHLPFVNILIASLTVLFGVAVVTFFVKRVL